MSSGNSTFSPEKISAIVNFPTPLGGTFIILLISLKLSLFKDATIKEITIRVANSVNNVKITVEKLTQKPADITVEISGKVYQYFNIDNENLPDENVAEAKVKFEVPTSWINQNEIIVNTIALNRFSGGVWQKLPTTRSETTTDAIIFEVTTPGFSTFAVAGESEIVAPVEEEVAPEEKPAEAAPTPVPTSTLMIVGIIIGIIIVAIIFVTIRRKKKR